MDPCYRGCKSARSGSRFEMHPLFGMRWRRLRFHQGCRRSSASESFDEEFHQSRSAYGRHRSYLLRAIYYILTHDTLNSLIIDIKCVKRRKPLYLLLRSPTRWRHLLTPHRHHQLPRHHRRLRRRIHRHRHRTHHRCHRRTTSTPMSLEACETFVVYPVSLQTSATNFLKVYGSIPRRSASNGGSCIVIGVANA